MRIVEGGVEYDFRIAGDTVFLKGYSVVNLGIQGRKCSPTPVFPTGYNTTTNKRVTFFFLMRDFGRCPKRSHVGLPMRSLVGFRGYFNSLPFPMDSRVPEFRTYWLLS